MRSATPALRGSSLNNMGVMRVAVVGDGL
eukprot:COSAG03_NODE_2284_length_2919_cov_1.822695_4_plen_28_part_01